VFELDADACRSEDDADRNSRVDERRVAADLRELAQCYAHTRCIKTFLAHDKIPVDVRHNSKLLREEVAKWAEAAEPLRLFGSQPKNGGENITQRRKGAKRRPT
jgi:hypothetical protein